MQRRSILLSLVALVAIALPTIGIVDHHSSARAATVRSTAARAGAPNVLVVMTDDMRYDDLQYMPRLRSFLMTRGTDFRNMFAPTPLCCPNRASFLTGKFPHNHHVWWHEEPWGYGAFDDSHTLATALRGAGYRTAYIGKYLNRYGIARPKASPGSRPATYVPAGWGDWRGTPDGTGLPESDRRAGGTYRYFDTTINHNGVLEGHPGRYNSRVLVDEGVKVLDRFATSSQPWYLSFNSLAPHHGGPRERDDTYLPTPARPKWVKGRFNAQITRGPGVPANGDPEADVSDKAVITRSMAPLDARARAAVRTEARQRAEALYVLDRQLQRVWNKLATTGQLANTIIAFTSDNGYMEGEHRWQAGKVIGFDPSYRIPLIVAGPGIPQGVRQYTPVTTNDLTASILDWTGAHLDGVDGTSFVGDIGRPVGWDRVIGYESYLPGIPSTDPEFVGPQTAIGVRTAGYFYVRYANGEAELFDLRRDPLELASVAADPAYADVRAELDTAWHAFKACKEADCDIPLPDDLKVDSATTGALREQMSAAQASYYG
jgi:arylsulfatase A-like enzyme